MRCRTAINRFSMRSSMNPKSRRNLPATWTVNENVKLFVKLPSWFKIDTPIDPYNPDWAFVTEREEKLYFVRERKSTLDNEERRNKENQEIPCGRQHFGALGVNYDVVTFARGGGNVKKAPRPATSCSRLTCNIRSQEPCRTGAP